MEIYVKRTWNTPDSTLGILTILDNPFTCYVLEDGKREVKIPGQTRIPAGRYEILLRMEGTKFEHYKEDYGTVGMIWLQNVPGFEYIYQHIGNYIEDTLGCQLLGYKRGPMRGQDYTIGDSHDCYLDYHKIISKALKTEDIFVNVQDEDP